MNLFFDASALAKFFHEEETDIVTDLILDQNKELQNEGVETLSKVVEIKSDEDQDEATPDGEIKVAGLTERIAVIAIDKERGRNNFRNYTSRPR